MQACFSICQHVLPSELEHSTAAGRTEKIGAEASLGTQTRALCCAAEVAFLQLVFPHAASQIPKDFRASDKKTDKTQGQSLYKNDNKLSEGMWADTNE